ncbi:hypothetical protein J6590_027960 [Homalodisca vitripennis]|nr:hypothetical protein J6590_027960 [Homalodisca vitripennis]
MGSSPLATLHYGARANQLYPAEALRTTYISHTTHCMYERTAWRTRPAQRLKSIVNIQSSLEIALCEGRFSDTNMEEDEELCSIRLRRPLPHSPSLSSFQGCYATV